MSDAIQQRLLPSSGSIETRGQFVEAFERELDPIERRDGDADGIGKLHPSLCLTTFGIAQREPGAVGGEAAPA